MRQQLRQARAHLRQIVAEILVANENMDPQFATSGRGRCRRGRGAGAAPSGSGRGQGMGVETMQEVDNGTRTLQVLVDTAVRGGKRRGRGRQTPTETKTKRQRKSKAAVDESSRVHEDSVQGGTAVQPVAASAVVASVQGATVLGVPSVLQEGTIIGVASAAMGATVLGVAAAVHGATVFGVDVAAAEVQQSTVEAEHPSTTAALHGFNTPATTWPGFEVHPPATLLIPRSISSGAVQRCRGKSQRNAAVTAVVNRVKSAVRVEEEDTPLTSQPDPPNPHMNPSSADEGTGFEMQESES